MGANGADLKGNHSPNVGCIPSLGGRLASSEPSLVLALAGDDDSHESEIIAGQIERIQRDRRHQHFGFLPFLKNSISGWFLEVKIIQKENVQQFWTVGW
jgi:hypothetical protein